MFSPNKKDDQEMLLAIAETIEVLIKIGTAQAWDLVEKFGEDYLKLQAKVKTYDYSKEDEITNRVNQRFNENYTSVRNN